MATYKDSNFWLNMAENADRRGIGLPRLGYSENNGALPTPAPPTPYNRTGDAFQLPYYLGDNGKTTNFTNPDGTGRGSISENLLVNGGFGKRMSDGKGSLSVTKLESPYGNSPQPQGLAMSPAQQYTPPNLGLNAYVGQDDSQLRPRSVFSNSSIGELIAAKAQGRQMAEQNDAALKQQASQLEQAKLGILQDQFGATLGKDYAKMGLDYQGGLADLYQKQQQAQQEQGNKDRQYGLDVQKLNLDQAKDSTRFDVDPTTGEPVPVSGPLAQMRYSISQGMQNASLDPEYAEGLKNIRETNKGDPKKLKEAEERFNIMYREMLTDRYMNRLNNQR